LTSLAGGEGHGEHLLYCNGSFKGFEATTALAEMLSCKLLSSTAADKKRSTLHDVMEIINGGPCQNSVLWRAAECHCQVADFMLNICLFKFKASNT
jgi:hypothetical protein